MRPGAVAAPAGGPTLGVVVNPDGSRTAGLSGLATCGSTWSCPVCSAKIAARRADELASVMTAIDAVGGSSFLVTLTMRHKRTDRLGLGREDRRRLNWLRERRTDRDIARGLNAQTFGDDVPPEFEIDEREAEAEEAEIGDIERRRGVWDALSYAWSRVTSGKRWTQEQKLYGGMLGWARVVEVTDGDNGWHCHAHILVAFRERVSTEAVEAVANQWWRRWDRALQRRGLDSLREHGVDVRAVRRGSDSDLAEYFLKASHELTSAHKKEGKHGGRTPMQLLAQVAETYDAALGARWWEWEAASEGRRQLEWSRGERSLRKLAELGPEESDEDIAAEEIEADERVGLTADSWDTIRREEWVCHLLEVTEDHGLDGARRWLHFRGLDWVDVTVSPPIPWQHRPRWADEARLALLVPR